MILAEAVGPYSIGFALVLLVGFPLTARYLKRSASFEAGPLKAKLGEIHQDAKRAAEAAAIVGESVGSANGAGSLQDQLAASARRQERIEEATANVQHMLTKVFQWQTLHSEEDLETFRQLSEAVAYLKNLIGEPGEGDLKEALIPYMHRLRHDSQNQTHKDRMLVELQHQTLVDAMEVLERMRVELDRVASNVAVVVTDLADAHQRADEVVDGEPGEAADAGAHSPKEDP